MCLQYVPGVLYFALGRSFITHVHVCAAAASCQVATAPCASYLALGRGSSQHVWAALALDGQAVRIACCDERKVHAPGQECLSVHSHTPTTPARPFHPRARPERRTDLRSTKAHPCRSFCRGLPGALGLGATRYAPVSLDIAVDNPRRGGLDGSLPAGWVETGRIPWVSYNKLQRRPCCGTPHSLSQSRMLSLGLYT